VDAADGLPTATLNVDTDNPSGAMRLYRTVGMNPDAADDGVVEIAARVITAAVGGDEGPNRPVVDRRGERRQSDGASAAPCRSVATV
jgi:hypothetical protein